MLEMLIVTVSLVTNVIALATAIVAYKANKNK